MSRWRRDPPGDRAAGVRAGALLSLGVAWALDTTFSFRAAAGYLDGFAAGQLATLAALVQGVSRAVPGQADEAARLAPAFREIRLLGAVGDRLTTSRSGRQDRRLSGAGGYVATFYVVIAAVAWFPGRSPSSPGLTFIVVERGTLLLSASFAPSTPTSEIGAPLRRLQHGAEVTSTEGALVPRGARAWCRPPPAASPSPRRRWR